MIFWHNPRCSKSRQTLALLREHGYDPEIRLYLIDAPNSEEIKVLLELLDINPFSLIRRGEKTFKALGLSGADSDEDLITAMADNPILIERPILIHESQAAIGRPPETVLNIL